MIIHMSVGDIVWTTIGVLLLIFILVSAAVMNIRDAARRRAAKRAPCGRRHDP